MAEGSDIRELVLNIKNNLIQHDNPNLLAKLEDAVKQAETVLRLSVFESEWGIFGSAWSPDTGYLNHLVRVKNFLDESEGYQSQMTAKYWSPKDERHWLHDKLYYFEDSLSKNLIYYSDELKKLALTNIVFASTFTGIRLK